jgi:hypothetical protein
MSTHRDPMTARPRGGQSVAPRTATRKLDRWAISLLAVAAIALAIAGLLPWDAVDQSDRTLRLEGIGDLVDIACALSLLAACSIALARGAEDLVLRSAFLLLGGFIVHAGLATTEYVHVSSPQSGALMRLIAGIAALAGVAALVRRDWSTTGVARPVPADRAALALAVVAASAELIAGFLPAFNLGGGATLSIWQLGRVTDVSSLLAAALLIPAAAAWRIRPGGRPVALLVSLCAGFLALPVLQSTLHGYVERAPHAYLGASLLASLAAGMCVARWLALAYPRR